MVMQTLIIAFFATVCVSIVAEVTKMIASRFSVYEIERLNRLK